MRLRWDAQALGFVDRHWDLPENVCIKGPAPERFGIRIDRQDEDSYAVRLLWDRTYLSWPDLKRAQLLASALAPLLDALGTDLWQLLSEPIPSTVRMPRLAA
jgi:hypothetical protein